MSRYASIKVLVEVKERLEEYARPRGLTLSAAISELLDRADTLSALRELRELLEEQNRLLREQVGLLRALLDAVKAGGVATVAVEPPEASTEDLELPSFAVGNPWLELLSKGRAP